MTEDYGPWMLVQRQRRRPKTAERGANMVTNEQENSKGKATFQEISQGSRYAAIASLEEVNPVNPGDLIVQSLSVDQRDKVGADPMHKVDQPRSKSRGPTRGKENITAGGNKGKSEIPYQRVREGTREDRQLQNSRAINRAIDKERNILIPYTEGNQHYMHAGYVSNVHTPIIHSMKDKKTGHDPGIQYHPNKSHDAPPKPPDFEWAPPRTWDTGQTNGNKPTEMMEELFSQVEETPFVGQR